MEPTSISEAPTVRADETPAAGSEPPNTSSVYLHYLIARRPDESLWELGRGGMGVTYKAIDTNLHCPVALKIIGPQSFGGEKSRHRFVREARLAARIRHPNVAAIYHLGSQDGEFFYAMEFIDGITAEAWVKGRGLMPVEMALDVAMQVARALTAADHLKLVHRDIKPGNIMLVPDPANRHRVIVKVIDFGLARSVVAEQAQEFTTCAFVGTPQFASPEQMENLELDIRSDIYALGCTLWFLLKGEAPFSGSPARVIAEHLTNEPPWARLEGIPKSVQALLRRMLAKDPAERPQDPVLLHAEISACREALTRASEPRPARFPFATRLPERTRLPLLWATALTVLLVAIFWPVSGSETKKGRGKETVAARPALPEPVPLPSPLSEPAEPAPLPVEPLDGFQATAADMATNVENLGQREPPQTWTPPPVWPDAFTSGDSEDSAFSLEADPPDAGVGADLQSDQAVALALTGLEPQDPDDASAPMEKPAARRAPKRSEERRSPFRPLDGIRRGVQGFVRRIF